MTEEKGGGATSKLWRKHGRGFYALMAVGTYVYLDAKDLIRGIGAATGVQDFVVSELVTFAIEAFVNFFFASMWPVIWFRDMGLSALYWAAGGYALWALLRAIALDRREKQLRKDLDL